MNGMGRRGVCRCVAVVAGVCAVLLPLAAGVHGQAATAGIHEAVQSGDAAAVRVLLDKTPAAVNSKDESGETPLHLAAGGSAAVLVPLLVDRGADVRAADKRGVTPLHLLASRGNLAGMTLLARRGANSPC